MIDIAVVVLNYRSSSLTIASTETLLKNNKNSRVIIVDNNSPGNDYYDLKKNFYSNPLVDVIKSDKNGGYSSGNNIGCRFIEKQYPEVDYIGIMNPDVVLYQENMIEQLKNCLLGHPNAVLATGIMYENNKINIEKIGWYLPDFREFFISRLYFLGRFLKRKKEDYIMTVDDQTLYFDTVQGSFFLIKANLFRKIGYFDENVFMYSEENILGAKIKKISNNYFAAVDLKCRYIHNHDYTDNSTKKLINITTQIFNSDQYYIRFYTDFGFVRRLVLKFLEFVYIHISLKIRKIIKKR